MKIAIQKSDLEYAVGLTLKALSSKVDGRLGVITMTAANDKLMLTTGDDGIVITSTVNVDVIEGGTVNVPGKLLYEGIHKTSNCELEIETVGERLMLNCIDGHVGLPILEAGWEGYKQANQGAKVVIASKVLKETIKKTVPFCSTDISRPILRGVNLVSKGQILTAAALDGYRVAKVNATLINSEAEFNVNVPATALSCIDSLIDAEGEVELLISSNENLLQIKTEDIEIVATLLQGAFVDTNRIIPKSYVSTLEMPKSALLQALDRAVVFGGTYNLAELDIKADNVVIKSQSDAGESVSKVTCKNNGQDLNIAFNAKYLVSALKLISAESVFISFSEKDGPATIKEQDALYLFLPLRRN